MNTIDNITTLTILFSEGGAPTIINEGDYRIEELRAIIHDPKLSLPEAEKKAKKVLKKTQKEFVVGGKEDFEVIDDQIYYKGSVLPETLNKVLFEMVFEKSINVDRFKKFVDRLYQNPSRSSVEELYDYISRNSCPINEDGMIIGWKSVDDSGWSHHGNTKTIVNKGEVDPETGKILNKIGEAIEVSRNQVDDDRSIGCSFGLRVGSYEYASSFSSGKLLTVLIDPADVVSIPTDCSYQKMRVCKYLPIGISEGKISKTCVNTQSNKISIPKTEKEILTESIKEIMEFEGEGCLIEDVIDELERDGINYGIGEVIKVLIELGYKLHDQEEGIYKNSISSLDGDLEQTTFW